MATELAKELNERRLNLISDAREILETRTDDTGALSAEDEATYQRLENEITNLGNRVDELMSLSRADKRAEDYREEYERAVPKDVREAAETEEKNALRKFLDGETKGFDVDFRGIDLIAHPKTGQYEIRDLVSNVAASGANTVPTSFRRTLYEHMIETAAIRQTNVTVLTTTTGEALEIPRTDAFGTAALLGEGTAAAEADPGFGQVTLNSWKYAQLLQITSELLTDSGVDIEGFIARDLGRALGQATGQAFVVGTGTNQPRGVMVAVAADVGTAVQVASATVETDNLIDLFYDVIPQYRQRGYWLMRDSTAQAIRKLKNADDAYVWQPGIQVGQPDQILGRPVVIDPFASAIGSANESVAFGDFSGFYIREVGGVQVRQSDDFAFSSDMRSYLGLMRVDSDLIDVNAIDVLDTD